MPTAPRLMLVNHLLWLIFDIGVSDMGCDDLQLMLIGNRAQLSCIYGSEPGCLHSFVAHLADTRESAANVLWCLEEIPQGVELSANH